MDSAAQGQRGADGAGAGLPPVRQRARIAWRVGARYPRRAPANPPSRPGGGHRLGTFVLAVLGFIVGAVVTYFAGVFGTLVVWDWLGVHDQDGGGAMALGLVIAPLCAIVGGIVGAFLLPAWIARRSRNAPPPTDDSR